MEMRLPGWVRSIVAISALMQLGFGIALLLHPARISELWPWTLPPLTARLLGASTLVSIPLAFLSIGINRYRMAMIPFVMMLTYRVLQLVAGVIHIDHIAAIDPQMAFANPVRTAFIDCNGWHRRTESIIGGLDNWFCSYSHRASALGLTRQYCRKPFKRFRSVS